MWVMGAVAFFAFSSAATVDNCRKDRPCDRLCPQLNNLPNCTSLSASYVEVFRINITVSFKCFSYQPSLCWCLASESSANSDSGGNEKLFSNLVHRVLTNHNASIMCYNVSCKARNNLVACNMSGIGVGLSMTNDKLQTQLNNTLTKDGTGQDIYVASNLKHWIQIPACFKDMRPPPLCNNTSQSNLPSPSHHSWNWMGKFKLSVSGTLDFYCHCASNDICLPHNATMANKTFLLLKQAGLEPVCINVTNSSLNVTRVRFNGSVISRAKLTQLLANISTHSLKLQVMKLRQKVVTMASGEKLENDVEESPKERWLTRMGYPEGYGMRPEPIKVHPLLHVFLIAVLAFWNLCLPLSLLYCCSRV